MKTFNKFFLAALVGFAAVTQIQAMDGFDFGDVVPAVGIADATLHGHAEAIAAANANVDARAIADNLRALVAVANDNLDLMLVQATLCEFMAANFAVLNEALKADAADHKALMLASSFTILKAAATGATVIHIKVREVLTAWQPILQATITAAILKRESKALTVVGDRVAALRHELVGKSEGLEVASREAATTRLQLRAATVAKTGDKAELERRLALLDAGSAALQEGARETVDGIASNSAK